jgi:hypothetical protein
MRAFLPNLIGLALLLQGPEQARYLRVTAKGTSTECTFALERTEAGWSIASATGRALTVTARYDAAGTLLAAEAASGTGDAKKTASVAVADGKARVQRPGLEAQEFEVPKGVIVTSAPDWTDTFRICRLWDRAKAGKQEFPGLWIHPVQPAQRLTFTAERTGTDTLDHGGRKLELDRLSIRLRGNSAYAAWADPAGRMIKLVSLPIKETGTVLVLEGFETSAAALKPE